MNHAASSAQASVPSPTSWTRPVALQTFMLPMTVWDLQAGNEVAKWLVPEKVMSKAVSFYFSMLSVFPVEPVLTVHFYISFMQESARCFDAVHGGCKHSLCFTKAYGRPV